MPRSRLISLIVGLAILSVSSWLIVVNFVGNDVAEREPTISTVTSTVRQTDTQATKTRLSIETLAKVENISIEEAEHRFASFIAEARQEARLKAEGYPPGAYFVSSGRQGYIDPKQVKSVPSGGVIDFDLIRDGKMPSNTARDSGRDAIYIEPLDISHSSLNQAKLIQSEPGGTYRNGEGYARTQELRNAERTPSGKSGWTGLTRVFAQYEQLGNVIFEESDNVAAGTTVLVPQSSINSTVDKFPATLIRLRDSGGKTMSDLSWIGDNNKTYSLKTEKIDDGSVLKLNQLADELMTTVGRRP